MRRRRRALTPVRGTESDRKMGKNKKERSKQTSRTFSNPPHSKFLVTSLSLTTSDSLKEKRCYIANDFGQAANDFGQAALSYIQRLRSRSTVIGHVRLSRVTGVAVTDEWHVRPCDPRSNKMLPRSGELAGSLARISSVVHARARRKNCVLWSIVRCMVDEIGAVVT